MKKSQTQGFPVLFHFKSFVDIFSIFTDILIFLRTFTDNSFWVKFLQTVRKFMDSWQPCSGSHSICSIILIKNLLVCLEYTKQQTTATTKQEQHRYFIYAILNRLRRHILDDTTESVATHSTRQQPIARPSSTVPFFIFCCLVAVSRIETRSD